MLNSTGLQKKIQTKEERESRVIFVIGNARSGTTMMGRILGNHHLIHTFSRELHFFEKLWASQDKNTHLSVSESLDLAKTLCKNAEYGFHRKKCLKAFTEVATKVVETADEHAPSQIYRAFLKYMTIDNGKVIPCEQTPGYVLYIQEILDLFPEGRIINMVRDPRDVLASQKKRWRRQLLGPDDVPFETGVRTLINYHPISTSSIWKMVTSAAPKTMEEHRILTVKYEDLLEDPGKKIRDVCEFIGVTYHENMLQIPMAGSSLVSDSPHKKGIDQGRVGNWKRGALNSAEIFICQMINSKTMKNFGYLPVNIFPNPFLILIYLFTFPFKLGLAVLLHARHIKDFKEAIQRRMRLMRS